MSCNLSISSYFIHSFHSFYPLFISSSFINLTSENMLSSISLLSKFSSRSYTPQRVNSVPTIVQISILPLFILIHLIFLHTFLPLLLTPLSPRYTPPTYFLAIIFLLLSYPSFSSSTFPNKCWSINKLVLIILQNIYSRIYPCHE